MSQSLFYSTNRRSPSVSLKDALLRGQAPDRGLYLPQQVPQMSQYEIEALRDKPYHEIAYEVLRRYTVGVIPEEKLAAICEECYDYEVPLERVYGDNYLMRLDRGPTASFKDFAARMMARWMRYFLQEDRQDLVILTATSGDTGSAVAHAFHNVDRIHMVVLFPRDEVSDRQRRQMTTLGGNVTVLSVGGKFDDCQAMVKRSFSDPNLKKIRFSSANSINIGRLLPQSVYYAYAYARLSRVGQPVTFSVPSGNFGDMMGGLLAKRMGVPVEKFVIATNANDEFPRFVETGTYGKIEPSRVCISNAMNVGHPSNLARLVDLYGGVMNETGVILSEPDMRAIRRDIFATSVDDAATRETIREAYRKHKTVLEPHGAVAWAGLMRYLESGARPGLAVSIETAHPAKFPEEITRTIGVDPALPPSLAGLDRKEEQYQSIGLDYGQFRDFLAKKYS